MRAAASAVAAPGAGALALRAAAAGLVDRLRCRPRAGFLTYQPVATFWVALAGALALARPVPAAALPRPLRRRSRVHGRLAAAAGRRPHCGRRAADASPAGRAAPRQRGRSPRLRRSCSPLAPGAGAATLVPGATPTTRASARARSRLPRGRPGGRAAVSAAEPEVVFPTPPSPRSTGSTSPIPTLAASASSDWANGNEVARVDNATVSRPPSTGRCSRSSAGTVVQAARGPQSLRPAAARSTSPGRPPSSSAAPVAAAGRLAWHVASRKHRRIVLKILSSGAKPGGRAERGSGSCRTRHSGAPPRLGRQSRSGASYLRLGRVPGGRGTSVETMQPRAACLLDDEPGGRCPSTGPAGRSPTGASSVYRTGF